MGHIIYSTDWNLDKIRRITEKRFPYSPKKNYHIFGLVDSISRPHISIIVRNNHKDFYGKLAIFFETNGLSFRTSETFDRSVQIGLRKDVRVNEIFSSQIISFLIRLHESKIKDFDEHSKIPNCPFKTPKFLLPTESPRIMADRAMTIDDQPDEDF